VSHTNRGRGLVEVCLKSVRHKRVVVGLPLLNCPQYPATAVDLPPPPNAVVLGREVDVYEGVSRKCHRQRALQVRPEPGMHREAVKDIDDLPVNEVRPEVYAVAVYHKAEVGRAREKPPVVGQHTVSGPSVVRPYLGVRESEAKGLQNTGDLTC
jgi:hypothetical protein